VPVSAAIVAMGSPPNTHLMIALARRRSH
jgi:hypothetical protein